MTTTPAAPAAPAAPSSIYCQQHYGISKSAMRFSLLNIFNLHRSKLLGNSLVPLEQLLSYNKLAKMRSESVLRLVTDGAISVDGIEFTVVYHSATCATCKKQDYLLLSFRQAAAEYGLPAYVLIKPFYIGVDDAH